MEVDELIKNLAKHISELISSGKANEHEIAEKTKALAELVHARAEFSTKKAEKKKAEQRSTEELAYIVSGRLPNIPEDQQNIKLSSSEIFRGKQIP